MARSLFQSTRLVSANTFLSRILGFARDMVLAQLFGATAGFDAFLVAFKIPNFMRRLFAEGAFAQAFVPVLAEYQQTKSEAEARDFVARMLGSLAAILFVVTLVAVIATPLLIMIFAPGFIDEPTRFKLSSEMLRITFPYLMLISLTAFAGAVLNCYGRFGIPAFTPVLLNLAMIGSAIYLSPYFAEPIIAVAWGVFIGGILQLLLQLPFLRRINMLPLPRISLRHPGVRRVLKLMIPALFGVSVAQISLLIDTIFASYLPTGSISWLYYSVRLAYFPLGVFGVALATVVLPHLSRKHAAKSGDEFSVTIDWALRSVFVIGIPSAVGLALLSGPLLTTLFEYGKFHTHDVIMSSQSLIAYALGLPAFMLIKILASGFYSQQNIKTPVKIAAVAVTANIVLNFALIFPLAHAGLALATSLSSLINAGLLYYYLYRRGVFQPQPGWGRYCLQLIMANSVMAAVIIWFAPKLPVWFSMDWRSRGLHLAALILGAIIAYFITLRISGLRLKQFKAPATSL